MKRIFLLLPVTALIALLLNTGCYKDNKEEMYPATTGCDTTNVTYTKDIQALVNASCATSGCHDATASGGYNLTTFAGAQTIAQNGRFLAVITAGTMPKNSSKLDDCSINKVSRWINLGTP